MKRLHAAALSTLAATAMVIPATPPAHAAVGEVAVFSTEFVPVTVFKNPRGCKKLPLDAHVLVNLTNDDVVTHADPFCLTPGLTIKEGYGFHVAGSGSFSVKD